MHTLVFCGSPHANGNTRALVDAFLEELGGESEIIWAYREKISPCVDCHRCWKQPGCAIQDGMQEIYAQIERADCIVIASPLYYSMLTGPLLSLLSRLQCAYANGRFLHHKLFQREKMGAVLLTGGGDGISDPALESAQTLLRAMQVRYVGMTLSHRTDEVPARKDETALRMCRELAACMREETDHASK